MMGLNRRALARHAFLPALGDIFLFFAALAASFWLREPALLNARLFLDFAPLFGLWIIAFYAFGLYGAPIIRDFVSLIGSLFGAALVCGLIGTTYFYVLLPYTGQSPKTHLLVMITLSHTGVFVWRRLWLWALDIHLLRMHLVFLGDDDQVLEIENGLAASARENGFVSTRWRWPGVDMVVADLEWVEEHWDKARVVLSEAVGHRVPVVSLDAFYESLMGKVSPEWASRPSWAIEHVLPRAGSSYVFVKRLVDIFAAGLMLVAFSPVLAALYILIPVMDRMPPLYGQRRVGFLGRDFILWKFRTMRPGADSDGPFSPNRESDSRVTPLGRVLRRYRLDELPQLWNVLLGEMALVGPRPEWVKEVEVLEKAVPNYHLRHLVTPGITGWAQVYYRATNDPKESVEKHHYDLYYLKHFSFALDFSILLKTVKRVFVHDVLIQPLKNPAPRYLRSVQVPGLDVGSIISRS